MSTTIDDLRFSVRLLGRRPGFTLIAVLALALGIGANTAIFSVVNGVLLQPLPYAQPNRLVMVYESTRQFPYSGVSYPDFLDWRRESRSFTALAAFQRSGFSLTGSGQPEHVSGEYVSADLLRLLGVAPILGRGFLPSEDRQSAAGVTILSYGLWKRRFAGDRHVLGRSLTLNGRDYTVIGVLPSNFRFRNQADLYVPIGQWNAVALKDRTSQTLYAMARLKPGVNLAAAQAEMTSIASRLARRYPKSNAGRNVALVSMHDALVGQIRPTLLLLLGAVGFVLIIACANVANLLLARSAARRRELAMRSALGASRSRLVRQLMTESIAIGVVAGALGLLLAFWGTQLVVAAIPDELPHTQHVAIDGHVLLFTLAVSLLTGAAFGIVPALHGTRINAQESLKEGARTSGTGRRRAEGTFIVVQIALAIVLLAGAGLMIQSIWRLWRVDPGFDTSHVLTTRIALSPSVAGNPTRIRSAFRDTLARVAEIPGVRSAAVSNLIPLSGQINTVGFRTANGLQPTSPNQKSTALWDITTPGYRRVMGIPLLQGRFFTDQDTTASEPVVVIDDVMAKHLFPNESAVGREIFVGFPSYSKRRIVGVVGHIKWGFDTDSTASGRDELYFPLAQVPDKFFPEAMSGLILFVRTATAPLDVVGAVRAAVAGPTEDQPIYGTRSMDQIISRSLAARRFVMLLLVAFSGTALILAGIGIYGVMSYAVSRRTQELGVRAALGATRTDVLKLVLRDGMALAVVGMIAGVLAALGLTRLLAKMLYGVQPTDSATLLVVCVTILGVSFLASYLPARRATRVDPMAALRYE